MAVDLNQALRSLEESLAGVLPSQPDTTWLEAVFGVLETQPKGTQTAAILQPGLDLVSRGGKRWRPAVMWLSFTMAGGKDFPWEYGGLVELPHNGSLIVDDIEDHGTERRGKPAVHLIYGEDVSINAGNLLYFLPTYLLEDPRLDDGQYRRLTVAFLRVMRRLHLGQGLDIQWHNDHGYIPPVDLYLQMCRLKTGSLVGLAAELGVILAGETAYLARRAAQIWEDIGVGFQVMDDVVNLTTGNPGKKRGDDIVEGKKSLPLILYASKSAEHQGRILRLLQTVKERRGREEVQPLVEEAIAELSSSGALDQAREEARQLLDGALAQLNTVFPPSVAREEAHRLVRGFLEAFPTAPKSGITSP